MGVVSGMSVLYGHKSASSKVLGLYGWPGASEESPFPPPTLAGF